MHAFLTENWILICLFIIFFEQIYFLDIYQSKLLFIYIYVLASARSC